MNAQSLVDLVVVSCILGSLTFFLYRFDRFAISYGAEILTTLGIFGCFLGVVLALWNLNPNDLISSMPVLLGAIRTAFISSLFGVGSALVLRTAQRFRKLAKRETLNVSGAMSLVPVAELIEAIEALRLGLVGTEQGTLLTQMKLLRQEQKDQGEEYIREFKNFASHMVDNTQKAMIEALKNVIHDFNSKLHEQFGDNFKKLNTSVGKLVMWQTKYKDELEIIKNAQESAASNMLKAVYALEVFVDKANTFSQITQDLRTQIEFLENNRTLLVDQQKGLSELFSKLAEVTPEFSTKSTEMLEAVRSGMMQVTVEASSVTQQMKDIHIQSSEDLRTAILNLGQILKETIGQTHTSIGDTIQSLGENIKQTQKDMNDLLTQSNKENQQQTTEALNQNMDILKQGVASLDESLEKELNTALETLSRQLASLSAKFVEDYAPLTDKLREVVQISKGL
jgi:multisubunit Na+/H+ antiporter MnhG subunit